MVFGGVDELVEAAMADAGVVRRQSGDELGRPVGAGIVDDRVLPVRVRLRQDARDAFLDVLDSVMDRRDDADEMLLDRDLFPLDGGRVLPL